MSPRIVTFLALVFPLAVSAAHGQESAAFIDWVRNSGFIFIGTVKTLGAATPTTASAPNSAIVTVDRVLESLPPAGNPRGQDVTIRLQNPQRFHAGQQAVFYTYIQSAGTTLGLVEVASQPPEQPEAITGRIADARRVLADQALAERLASAEIIVVGVLGAARPTPEALDPVSEHDPRWYRAAIRVESFEKGATTNRSVTVNVAYGDDVVWRRAPKPKAGDGGVFLLQPDRAKRFRVSGLFLIEPLDWMPKSELERVRRLLKAPR